MRASTHTIGGCTNDELPGPGDVPSILGDEVGVIVE
jgi:hypothetical protein